MSRPQPLTPAGAHEVIQALLNECGERLRKPTHARERMIERGVNDDDILTVLRDGFVQDAVWHDERQQWRYAVCGCDLDGVPVVVIVVLEPQHCRITVITVTDTP